jgi:hypothetical protein
MMNAGPGTGDRRPGKKPEVLRCLKTAVFTAFGPTCSIGTVRMIGMFQSLDLDRRPVPGPVSPVPL